MKKNNWTDDTENSIINFLNEKDIEVKNKIFTNELLEPIEELIEHNYNKINRYAEIDLSEVKEDILTYVYENLSKPESEYIKDIRSRFSYVSRIIRCQLGDVECKHIKRKKTLVSIDDIENL